MKIRQDISIGHNIRLLRTKTGYTQAQVIAKLQLHGCNISRGTYAKIEAGIYNIRVSELILLRKIFKAEYSDFFAGIEVDDLQF